jgi:hypothetical protein
VKAFLVLSQSLCLLSLLHLDRPKLYRVFLVYLACAIGVTAAYRAESAWAHSWYLAAVGPLAVLRLAAGAEVLYRQTSEFRYWVRLAASAGLLAVMLAGVAWVQSGRPGSLATVVELRRLAQIFLGAVFLIVECFWLSQGGGWWRRADQTAAALGLLACNHAAVSFLAGLAPLSPGAWEALERASWLVDGFAYLLLTAIFRGVPLFSYALAAWFRFRPVNREWLE